MSRSTWIVSSIVLVAVVGLSLLVYFLTKKDEVKPTEATPEELKLLTTNALMESQIDVAFCSSETCCHEFNQETLSWGSQCDEFCNKEIVGTNGMKYGQFQKSQSIPVCGFSSESVKSASAGPVETFLVDKAPPPPLQLQNYGIWTNRLIERLLSNGKTLGSGGPHSNNFSNSSGKYIYKFWNQQVPNDFSLVPKITSGTNIALGSGYSVSKLNASEPNTLGVQSKKKNVFKPYQIVKDNGVSLTWDNSIIRTREAVSSFDFRHGLQNESINIGLQGNALLDGINVSGTFNYNTNRSSDSTTNISLRTDQLFVSQGSLYISNDSNSVDARIPYCRTDGIDPQVFRDLVDYGNPRLVDQYFTYKNNNGNGPDDINNDQTLEGYRNFMFQWGDHVLMEVAYGAKFIMRNFSSDGTQITKDDMTMKFCMEAEPIGAGSENPNTPVPPDAPNGDGGTLPRKGTLNLDGTVTPTETDDNYNLRVDQKNKMLRKNRIWQRIKLEGIENSRFNDSSLFDLIQEEDLTTPTIEDEDKPRLGDLVSVRQIDVPWKQFKRGKVTNKNSNSITVTLDVPIPVIGSTPITTIVLNKDNVTVDNLMFNMPSRTVSKADGNPLADKRIPPLRTRVDPDIPTFFETYDLPTPITEPPAPKDDPLFDFGMCAGWTKEQYDEMRSKNITTKLKFLIGDTKNPIVANLLAKESLVGITADELQQFYDAGLTESATPIGFTFVPIWDILKEAINNVYSRNPDYRNNVLRPNYNELDEFIIRTPKKLTPTPRERSFWDQTINNLKTAYIQRTVCPLQKDSTQGVVTSWMDADPSTINPDTGISTYQCKTLDYDGCMTDGDCKYEYTFGDLKFHCYDRGRSVQQNQGGSNRYACDLATHTVSQQVASVGSNSGEGHGCSWNYGDVACRCQDNTKNTKVIWDSVDRYYCNIPEEPSIQPTQN